MVAEPAPAQALPPAGRPQDPAVLAQAAAKVGIEILDPPGALPVGRSARRSERTPGAVGQAAVRVTDTVSEAANPLCSGR